jgi:hypothetical protein
MYTTKLERNKGVRVKLRISTKLVEILEFIFFGVLCDFFLVRASPIR